MTVGEFKEVQDKKTGKKEMVYHCEETDVLVQRNTSRIIKITANPNNYTLDDLLQVDKKTLHGVSNELRKKLIEEAKEIIKSKNREDLIKEIGDIEEILISLIKVNKLNRKEITKIRISRKKSRGGFEKRIFLKFVK